MASLESLTFDNKQARTTIFLDGACSPCRREIAHYRRLKNSDATRSVDISCGQATLGTHKKCIQLLAFGATRRYELLFRERLYDLLRACINGNDENVNYCAAAVGYTDPSNPPCHRNSANALLRTATEPVRIERLAV